MSFRGFGFALLCALPACSEPAPARIYNTCESDKECRGRTRCDEDPEICTRCDEELAMCVNDLARTPYQVRILVSRLPRGEGLVDRFAFPPFQLEGSDRNHALNVPPGMRVFGKVSGEVDEGNVKPINAEFAFTPRVDATENQRIEAFVTESRGYAEPDQINLVADLAAATVYDVRVIPLGRASALSPPQYLQLDTSVEDVPLLNIDNSGLKTLRGVLTNEAGQLQAGKDVRLIEPLSADVLSVTRTVANDGSFELRAPASVLDSRDYRLQISLDPDNPWQTTIELDPTRLDPAKEVAITIPAVPERVTFKGRVEKGAADIAAELTFISEFKPPSETAGDLHDRDWCRSSVPEDTRPSIDRCQTSVRTVTDAAGRFSVALLPGDYTLHVSPGNDSSSSRGARSALFETVVIETQPKNAPQQGQVFKVSNAARYLAFVRNERGEPLRGVVVRAVALRKIGELGIVAAINRSTESVTAEDGSFELELDVGYYDLVARAGDGFPWVYVTNLQISEKDALTPVEVTGFVIPAPLVLEGTVRNAGQVARNAAIDAYAEVPSLTGGKRLVLLARTTSDERGDYMLTLPPEIVTPSPADSD
jgi:hypothetical protein